MLETAFHWTEVDEPHYHPDGGDDNLTITNFTPGN